MTLLSRKYNADSPLLSIHVTIKEQLSISLQRDGGLNSFELKGDLDLRVTDADQAKIKLTLASNDYSDLQFKQHPNVAKFAPSGDKVIALKDASRSFPVGQGLGVLRWRMTGKDESNVPLTGEFGGSLSSKLCGMIRIKECGVPLALACFASHELFGHSCACLTSERS